MALLFDFKQDIQKSLQYSPQIFEEHAFYSPTYAQQYQLQYTAPVIQIQSPGASVTQTKKQTATQRVDPITSFTPTSSPTQSQAQAEGLDLLPLAVIGVIGLIAYGYVSSRKKKNG